MKFSQIVIGVMLCLEAMAVPVPKAEESIDLVTIPLNGKELDILTFAESDGSLNERNKRTIGILRELFPQLSKVRAEDENLLESRSIASDTILETIRVARETNIQNNSQNNKLNNDQEAQSSEKAESKKTEEQSSSIDELTLDSLEDDENRGKRFLNFGASSASDQLGGSGSSGGSGNFLFDIIRHTTDRVARGAGSLFRVVAGTESLDSAIKNFYSETDVASNDDIHLTDSGVARSTRNGDFSLLVSGSSGTEQTDESHNGADTDVGKGDGYTEGIPGPVTRLFVLANRGLSNLIQDLILRIAQTSERVVNFKARLITSLI